MKKKIFNINEIMLDLFAIIIFCGILTYSMLPFAGSFIKVRYGLIILLFILSLLTQKHEFNQWVLFIIGIIIITISLLLKGIGLDYLFMIIAMFSVSTISPKKLMEYSAKVIFLTLILLAIVSYFGIIPNLTFSRDSVFRQSLGTIYPLTFAGYVFYGIAAWLTFKDPKNISIKKVLIIAASALIVFKITAARNDTIAILLLLIVMVLNHIRDSYNKVFILIFTGVTFLSVIFSVFITIIVPYYSNSFNFFNSLFNNRLGLQNTLLDYYSPKLFGQIIPQVGAGGTIESFGYYFYIDNSFARLLFMFGIIFSIFFLFLLLNFICKLINLKIYKLTFIILIAMLSGIFEDSFINPVVNIFLYLLLVNKNLLVKDFLQ